MNNLLEVKNISKHFGGLKAVDNVSMEVKEGEVLGIIGPNGAGKTTFFNLITGTYPLTSGQIYFDGKEVTNYTPEKMAGLGVARTFQNIKLFKFLSVLENIKAGFHIQLKTNIFDAMLHTKKYKDDEENANEKSKKLLERIGLIDQIDLMAGNLPYGWQRRLEIGRALALSPKLLLLDEPAAGMNPSETVDLMKFIKALNKDGITIVVIEHDMKFIMNLCDRIVVINHGTKLAEGTPGEVSKNKDVIEAYLGADLSIKKNKRGEN